MLLLGDQNPTLVLSASDVSTDSPCDFRLLRTLDHKLRRIGDLPDPHSPMMERLAKLGDEHERRYLENLKETYSVIEIPLATYDREGLEANHEETIKALRESAPVVYQGGLFDGSFHGRADFIVFDETLEKYVVHDTKLARRAKVSALLQVAAYVQLLEASGINVSRFATIDLGNGQQVTQDVSDIIPVYLERRHRLNELLTGHLSAKRAAQWSDDSVQRCGGCEVCLAEVETHRDLLLVAGLRRTQRNHLRTANPPVTTIEELATLDLSSITTKASESTLRKLQTRAALQVRQDNEGYDESGRPNKVFFEVVDEDALRSLPPVDNGDVFFDFEGDPLWSDDNPREFGLEYLFGLIEHDSGEYHKWWAHNRAEERQALLSFLEYLKNRRTQHPEMHVYHYAPYERTALSRLTARYGEGEEYVDELLREGVFVDLYATVRQGIRVSQPSYSLKKLEPLYMETNRSKDLDNAADSILQYQAACEERELGNIDNYKGILDGIAKYNRYDCESTRGLRTWLLQQVGRPSTRRTSNQPDDRGSLPEDADESHRNGNSESDGDVGEIESESKVAEVRRELRETSRCLLDKDKGGAQPLDSNDRRAITLVAAALKYFEREAKPFWSDHFRRLSGPLDDWTMTKDVLIPDRVEAGDWTTPKGAKAAHRESHFYGAFPEGSTIEAPSSVYLHYDDPPEWLTIPPGASRAAHPRARIKEIGEEYVVVDEWLPQDASTTHSTLPVALSPGQPINTLVVEEALLELGTRVYSEGLVEQPALDILRRRPSRFLKEHERVAEVDGDFETAITKSLLGLNNSYLAVQGPPGTGKTYVGARVIKNLVSKGWKIGGVAQSHAVIDNFLDALAKAGVEKDRLAKRENTKEERAWRILETSEIAHGFLEEGGGRVLGATAWALTNKGAVARQSLDLLVIDEAGQFSLASTLAVSVAAQRLLLLGDPQQLPQVSQGFHPEPVDSSALAWLCDSQPTLPKEYGYFLNVTHRMHSTLCASISTLSYDGQLTAAPSTRNRSLQSLKPGIHVKLLDHSGNSVRSKEEAEEVIGLVKELVGRVWRNGESEILLGQTDIMVVAAYNAQVHEIRQQLRENNLKEVPVGTIDNFQGQEAPVVIVSMAASNSTDVPRGMDFLLSRNRINVAVSRAQWATFIVRSRELTNYLPLSINGLEELGAFIRLTEPQPSGTDPTDCW